MKFKASLYHSYKRTQLGEHSFDFKWDDEVADALGVRDSKGHHARDDFILIPGVGLRVPLPGYQNGQYRFGPFHTIEDLRNRKNGNQHKVRDGYSWQGRAKNFDVGDFARSMRGFSYATNSEIPWPNEFARVEFELYVDESGLLQIGRNKTEFLPPVRRG